MRRMHRGLRLYILGVIAAGGAALSVAIAVEPPVLSRHDTVLIALLVLFAVLAHLAPVTLAPKQRIVFDTPLHVVALLALPLSDAALLAAGAVALGNVLRGRPWFNILFNAAQVALSVLAAGATYHLLTPVSLVEDGRNLRSVLALIPATALLYLIGTVAVDVAAAIQRRRSPLAGWFRIHGPELLPHVMLVGLGAAGAPAIDHSPWLAPVLVAPVVAVRAMVRGAVRFDRELARVAEMMADTVEAAHPALAGRSRQMAELARWIARAHGRMEDDIERIALAARLHDLGASGTIDDPDGIDERPIAWPDSHAAAAAEYVANGLGLPDIADLIRSHHDRFDGYGAEHGPFGADIPLGARILAVCEAWTTLTASTEHRPAFTPAQAMVVLRAGAGTQWDPKLVETLDRVAQESGVATSDGAPTVSGNAAG
ncbi:MAG: HD domain-containing protein [Chloroflexi bacterium]|nr:HD domain-containing protein [Chloroflexota bacterium]